MEEQRTQNNDEKEQSWKTIILPDLNIYYGAIVVKKVTNSYQGKGIDQNKIESPEIDPHMYGLLLSDKSERAVRS